MLLTFAVSAALAIPPALLEVFTKSFQVLTRQERAHCRDPQLPARFASKLPERFCCTVA